MRKGEYHRMKVKITKAIKCQYGAASVVEYTLILPLCLVVFVFLFLAAYYLSEKAILDAAAHRAVLVAQRFYGDVQFKNFADTEFTDSIDYVGYKKKTGDVSEIKSEPYRYFLGRTNLKINVEEAMKAKAKNCVETNRLYSLGDKVSDLYIDTSFVNGIFTKSATVTISETFHMPKIVKLIGIETEQEINVTAKSSVSDVTELISNIDFVMEVLEDVGADKYLENLKSFFKKIGNFVESLSKD